MATLDVTPLFDLSVRFADDDMRQQAGAGGRGKRFVAPAAAGTFAGPHLRGEVIPPWLDYAVERADGVTEHEIRAVLRTEDGAQIYMEYEGIGHRGSLGPLREGTGLTFRAVARFETGDERYAWLNRVLAVMVAHSFAPGGFTWSVHAVL